jgi:hypothetical protein
LDDGGHGLRHHGRGAGCGGSKRPPGRAGAPEAWWVDCGLR